VIPLAYCKAQAVLFHTWASTESFICDEFYSKQSQQIAEIRLSVFSWPRRTALEFRDSLQLNQGRKIINRFNTTLNCFHGLGGVNTLLEIDPAELNLAVLNPGTRTHSGVTFNHGSGATMDNHQHSVPRTRSFFQGAVGREGSNSADSSSLITFI
jgi:hypothetical protein